MSTTKKQIKQGYYLLHFHTSDIILRVEIDDSTIKLLLLRINTSYESTSLLPKLMIYTTIFFVALKLLSQLYKTCSIEVM